MANDDIVYLISTAGHPNYGDELIAAGWLRYLAQRRPEAQVWLDCPQPGRAAVLLDGLHPHLHVTDTLWQVAFQANGEDRGEAHARARHLAAHRGTPREDLGLELAASAASIHLIGGGHLTSQWPANLLLPTIASELHRTHEVPVYMTGAGLLPIDDADADLLAEAFTDFAHADARDASSADRFGLPREPDDAFLGLWDDGTAVDARPVPRGMLLLQGDLHDRALMTMAVTKALDAFRKEGLEGEEIGVVEAIPPDDSWLLATVQEQWERVRFFPFAEIWQQGLPAHPDQVWVTSRFHAHMIAAAQGARGIAVNTGIEYYEIKHRSLLAHGTEWALVTPDEEWPGFPEAGAFPKVARRMADGKRRTADDLYSGESRKRGLFGRSGQTSGQDLSSAALAAKVAFHSSGEVKVSIDLR